MDEHTLNDNVCPELNKNWVQQLMPVVLALQELRQGDRKLKDSLGYILLDSVSKKFFLNFEAFKLLDITTGAGKIWV